MQEILWSVQFLTFCNQSCPFCSKTWGGRILGRISSGLGVWPRIGSRESAGGFDNLVGFDDCSWIKRIILYVNGIYSITVTITWFWRIVFSMLLFTIITGDSYLSNELFAVIAPDIAACCSLHFKFNLKTNFNFSKNSNYSKSCSRTFFKNKIFFRILEF